MSLRENPSLLLSLLYLVFIVYGTTIPFDFTTDPVIIAENVSSIRWIPFHKAPGVRESIPDMVSNVLLFLPCGALILYAGLRARRKWSLWVVLLFTLLVSASLSALVEALQILSPSRTSSITDLLTNTMGAACGMVISLGFDRWAEVPLAAWCRRNISRSPAVLLLIVYACLLIVRALVPLDISLDVGSIKQSLKLARLDPFADPTPLLKMLDYILWFAGLCYLLSHVLIAYFRRLRNFWAILASLAISTFLAAALELAQIFTAFRVTTTRDILAGLAGALYGGILFLLLNRSAMKKPSPIPDAFSAQEPLRGRKLFWLVLAHYLVYLVHEALYPYTFCVPPQVSGVIHGALLPFSAYYGKTNVLALFDFLGGIARYAPLGFLAQGYGTPLSRSSKWRAIALGLGLGVFLETLQLGVVGRYADISDVIAAGCGGYVGVVVWRWWRGAREAGGERL